jgi:hypothetical protein
MAFMLLMIYFSAPYHVPRTLNILSSGILLPDAPLSPGGRLPEDLINLFHTFSLTFSSPLPI